MILLPLVAILGYAFVLTRAASWPVETSLLSVICLIIALLFWAGFLGVLQPFAWVLLGGGIVALSASLVPNACRQPLRECFTPGLFAFVALSVIYWMKLEDAHVSAWDEFSHWALQGKVISLTHGLPTKGDPIVFKDYPPGTALFQYFVNLGSRFSEGAAMAAHGAITLAAIVALLQGLRWRQLLSAAAVLLIAYGLVHLLGQGFNTLLIDQAIGAVFGATLTVYFLAPRGRLVSLLYAMPGLLALPLMKEIGLQLALLAAAIITFDSFVQLVAWRRSQQGTVSDVLRVKHAIIFSMGALLIAPIVSKVGWEAYTKRIEAAGTFKFRPSMDQVVGSFVPSRATDRDRETIAAFGRAFTNESATIVDQLPLVQSVLDTLPSLQRLELAKTNPPELPAITALHWLVVLLFASIPICLVQPEGYRRRAAALQVCLALGFALYLFGHLVAYLFAFSEYEGTRVASFSRYMRSYLFAWSLVLLALLALAVREGQFRRPVSVALAIGAVLSMLFLPARAVHFLERPAPGMIPQRAALKPQLDWVKSIVQPSQSVYIIFQNTDGFEHWITKYELAPARTNLDCWSVGARYGRGDAWTCDLSPEELGSRLRKYDYVYLARPDAPFWQRFGGLFARDAEAGNYFLFSVQTGSDGAVRIVPVSP